MFRFTARFAEMFRSVKEALARRLSRGAGHGGADAGETVRRSKVMASLFPCYYNRNHRHEPGTPHTCNSFLLGPRIKHGKPHKVGAHKIVVSYYVGMRAGRRRSA